MPTGFKDDPSISGILTWEGLPGGAGTATSGGGNAAIVTSGFNIAEWQDDQGRLYEFNWRPGISGSDFGELPYVYGNKPLTFVVKWQALNKLQANSPYTSMSMKIELPPNHKTAPAISPRAATIGKWHVHFAPAKPLSSGFAIRHSVTIDEAKSGDVFLLDAELDDSSVKGGSKYVGLLIEDRKESHLLLPIGRAVTATFTLRRVRKVVLDLRFVNVSGPPGDSKGDLVDQKGRAVGRASYFDGRRIFIIGSSSTDRFADVALDEGSFFVAHWPEPTSQKQILRFAESKREAPLHEGQRLKGSAYETIETAVAKVNF